MTRHTEAELLEAVTAILPDWASDHACGYCHFCFSVAILREAIAELLEHRKSLSQRDVDWCLAFADAVGGHFELTAPITPEGVKACIETYAAHCRAEKA